MTKNPPEKQSQGHAPSPKKHIKVIKLHYFDIRGSCQPIINLLYHLKIQFQLIYVEKNPENISDVGFSIGIPYIQDGEIRLHQTIAIMHYLCRKSERSGMIGLTPQSSARKQQLLMKYFVQRKKINILILQSICMFPTRPDKFSFAQLFLKKLCNQHKYIDYCLRKLARGNQFIWDEVSIVDFLFYETCFYVSGFFGKYINNNTLYRFFREFKNRFENLPFFEKNKPQIEQVALFMVFSDEAINEAIEELWEGGPYKLLNRK